MLLYFRDVRELKLIEIGLMFYKREISNTPASSILTPRLNKLIDKIDKEIEYYYDTSEQKD